MHRFPVIIARRAHARRCNQRAPVIMTSRAVFSFPFFLYFPAYAMVHYARKMENRLSNGCTVKIKAREEYNILCSFSLGCKCMLDFRKNSL